MTNSLSVTRNANHTSPCYTPQMLNPWCHHIDCEFWHDQCPDKCTCAAPPADRLEELRAMRVNIVGLKRQIEQLEDRAAALEAFIQVTS
jgi:hypothetical protein